ncbi:hypothetical protein ACS3YM_18045 [Nocardia sp. N13]|uniref:hypothetical protein n=1 Tax=Nocardioides sp. N13(2025) TaxID=3453405 RepID=UPI003F76B99D
MKLVMSAVVASIVLSALPSASAVVPDARPSVASISKAVVKASSKEVTEGDRITLRVRVPQSGNAKRVTLQERVEGFSTYAWTDVASKRALARVKFRTTVTARNEAVYRVAITYRNRLKPVDSRPVKVTVWRWIQLREFTPYFQTFLAGYGEADINGDRYAVWGGYAGTSVRAWEARVTPGRNCTRFRAVLGLADTSDDESSGVVAFATDEATTIYQSPALTPGMALPVELNLSRPYRFGMTAANTSAETIRSYPRVGDGAFYCTGIEN